MTDAEVLAWLAHSILERRRERFFSHNNAPPRPRTAYPALVRRRLGAGQVLYSPVPIFKHYHCDSYYPLRHLVLGALDTAAPNQLVHSDAPAQMELVLRRRDRRCSCIW